MNKAELLQLGQRVNKAVDAVARACPEASLDIVRDLVAVREWMVGMEFLFDNLGEVADVHLEPELRVELVAIAKILRIAPVYWADMDSSS